MESLKRFYEPEDIHNPQMILLVGALGLVVNLLGLCLFHEHGHSHGGGGGGHGHSHGGGKKEGKKEGERGGFLYCKRKARTDSVQRPAAMTMRKNLGDGKEDNTVIGQKN